MKLKMLENGRIHIGNYASGFWKRKESDPYSGGVGFIKRRTFFLSDKNREPGNMRVARASPLSSIDYRMIQK